MKFTKFSKAFLVGALSAGVVFGISSCVVSYTVGYLYVTGTQTAQPAGQGVISGYKIDHNTGQLSSINGLPVSSGGANPVRAVLLPGSRFLYVLNRGVNALGNSNCTTANPCQNANITEFAVGGNGILTPQQTFYTQGVNPFRLVLDSAGSYLMVLDHDSPDNYAATYNAATNGCTLALGAGVKTCGDVTVFSIQETTGRLSLVQNAQVSAAGGQALTYFPVPAYPVDVVLTSTTLLTLSAAANQSAYPYTGGHSVFPYTYNASNGQLTLSLNSAQSLGANVNQATRMVSTNTAFFVLDNEAPVPNPTGASSQLLPYDVVNGTLSAKTGGIIPDDATLSNPIDLVLESKSKFLYVANQGNNTGGVNAQSGISAYFINTNPAFQATPIAGQPFGSGAGPQCIAEDPSNQFIYTVNFNDSSITGRTIDVNSGVLNNLRNTNSYALPGPATWCLMDGRTN